MPHKGSPDTLTYRSWCLGEVSLQLKVMEDMPEAQSEAPKVTNVVIDGAAVVQMLKPGSSETFEEYAHKIFIPYISGQLQHVSRLDLVWDSYVANTLKATAREKRGKGIRQRVVASARIPRNWNNFLPSHLQRAVHSASPAFLHLQLVLHPFLQPHDISS